MISHTLFEGRKKRKGAKVKNLKSEGNFKKLKRKEIKKKKPSPFNNPKNPHYIN